MMSNGSHRPVFVGRRRNPSRLRIGMISFPELDSESKRMGVRLEKDGFSDV